jgi:acetyltransferase-like isoleucine patch superfamily enzyme
VLRRFGMDVRHADGTVPIEDPAEHLVLDDSVFLTPELLQRFTQESRKDGRDTVCALKPGLVTRHTIVATQVVDVQPDRVKYALRYSPGGRRDVEPTLVLIDPDQFSELVPLPEHTHGGRELRIPVSDTLLIQVDHWANLWAVNIAFLLAEVARLRKAPWPRLLALALRARSTNRWNVLRKLNRIGRDCDIHPTAYIEGSTIGDRVSIGAGSVIRLSHVGSGASIGSNATVECSVIGEGCALDSMSGAFASVLYPGTASSAKLVYISVCGRDSFLADGVYLSDFRFDRKNVTVMKNGAVVDTDNVGLGACLGHGVYLGAGCVVAPGRAIPNGLRLVPGDERTVSGFDRDGSVAGHRVIAPHQE